MNTTLRIREIQITPLAIPMRVKFEHAAATRNTADPVILRLVAEASNDVVGYGETLARPYVTGETADGVIDDIVEHFAPRLLDFHVDSFPAALEFAEQLPSFVEGRVVNAARAAVELAVIDLAGNAYGRRAAEVATWLELPHFGAPGCLKTARYSGMVVGRTSRKRRNFLRVQRWYGLRDFKLKVAVEGWQDRLADAHRVLGSAIRAGKATLRVDANGGWTPDQALEHIDRLESHGVSAIEQPLQPTDDGHLAEIARRATACDLIADESLLTLDDGKRLMNDCGVRVLNVRIAKNGGLIPALRLADHALRADRDVQLGCLVGETSILSAAGISLLECCPRVRFVEGAFGAFLLGGDVTSRPIRFGYGGRLARRARCGLGIEVNAQAVQALAAKPSLTMHL
jgi:muconate cycloisomerase